jgi:hypothetical protein
MNANSKRSGAEIYQSLRRCVKTDYPTAGIPIPES